MVSNAQCQGCGLAVGSEHHRVFECPFWQGLREQFFSTELKAWLSSDLALQLGRTLTEGHVSTEHLGQAASWEGTVTRVSEEGGFRGLVFIDGSCMAPRDECLRRSGWSIVEMADNGTVV
eukprot:5456586-Amphidinium_carterae.1